MILNELKGKKILILGFGREGIDNFKFLRKLFPKKLLGVGDRLEYKKLNIKNQKLIKKDKNIKLHFGENYLKALKNYDVIIKSPGIPPRLLKPFLKKGQMVRQTRHKIITSQTEIFFKNCKGIIIGVTGTKGKSTTVTLIYKILKEGGVRAHLIGNIGKPVLSFLFADTPKDIYVYELSSHQLLNLKKSPHIAVFLNVYPEHLDYYRDFDEYLKAKQNICRHQKKEDYFIYNPKDKNVRKTAKITKAKKIPINPKIKKIPLIGKFNLQNVAAAIEVGKILGISDKNIKAAIKKFKPLPYRLEFVGKFRGIKFYNDALSTIPEATILAIGSLGKDVQTILLGGSERYQNFKELAKKILKSKIKNIILFPTTRDRIMREILKEAGKLKIKIKNVPNCFFVNNMKDAVKICYQYTKRGKICLLSTASPSFSIFRDYREKGNLFKKYVKDFSRR